MPETIADLIKNSRLNAAHYDLQAMRLLSAARKSWAEADAQEAAADPTKGWAWFAGDNEETYRIGPCANREDAIAEAKRAGIGPDYGADPAPYTLYLIEARQDAIDLSEWIDIDTMVETMHENLANDLGGEDGDSPAEDGWTDEQHADLATSVKAAVAAWQARHAIVVTPRRFTGSRNAERITIPESAKPAGAEAPIAAE